MATFTQDGKRYEDPPAPAKFDGKPGLAKAWRRGWMRGIAWNDRDVIKRYKTASMQNAFHAGFQFARHQRAEAGETVIG